MKITRTIRARSRAVATLHRLGHLLREGRYEEVEAGARALVAEAARLRRRGLRLSVGWHAKALATAVACAHGRGAQVLAELESLAADLKGTTGSGRTLLLMVRNNHVMALGHLGRCAEAEAEALDLLRELTRIKHLAPVWKIEQCALANLADALYYQDRHEEAEAIARGNLPRAEGAALASLHCTLVRSLSGQGRHDEALTEARRFVPRWTGGRAAAWAWPRPAPCTASGAWRRRRRQRVRRSPTASGSCIPTTPVSGKPTPCWPASPPTSRRRRQPERPRTDPSARPGRGAGSANSAVRVSTTPERGGVAKGTSRLRMKVLAMNFNSLAVNLSRRYVHAGARQRRLAVIARSSCQ